MNLEGILKKGEVVEDMEVAWTVAQDKMLQKMKRFLLADLYDYVKELISAEIEKSPSNIKIKALPWKFEIKDDGEGYSQTEINNLISQMFFSEKGTLKKYEGLARGVYSALQTPNAINVTIESVKGKQKTKYTIDKNFNIEDTGEPSINRGTRITVKKNYSLSKANLLSLLHRSVTPEARKIRETCRNVKVPIRVNYRRINEDIKLKNMFITTDIKKGRTRIKIGIPEKEKNKMKGKVLLYRNGIYYDTHHNLVSAYGVVVVLDNPDFSLNLSRNRIQDDKRYISSITEIDEAVDTAYKELYKSVKDDIPKSGANKELGALKRHIAERQTQTSNEHQTEIEKWSVLQTLYRAPIIETCNHGYVSLRKIANFMEKNRFIYTHDYSNAKGAKKKDLVIYTPGWSWDHNKYNEVIITRLQRIINMKRERAGKDQIAFDIKDYSGVQGKKKRKRRKFGVIIKETQSKQKSELEKIIEKIRGYMKDLTTEDRRIGDYIMGALGLAALGAAIIPVGILAGSMYGTHQLIKRYQKVHDAGKQKIKSAKIHGLDFMYRTEEKIADGAQRGWYSTKRGFKKARRYTWKGIKFTAYLPFAPAHLLGKEIAKLEPVRKAGKKLSDILDNYAGKRRKKKKAEEEEREQEKREFESLTTKLEDLLRETTEENEDLLTEFCIPTIYSVLISNKRLNEALKGYHSAVRKNPFNFFREISGAFGSRPYDFPLRPKACKLVISPDNKRIRQWLKLIEQGDNYNEIIKSTMLTELLKTPPHNIRWGVEQPATKKKLNYEETYGSILGSYGVDCFYGTTRTKTYYKNIAFFNKKPVSQSIVDVQIKEMEKANKEKLESMVGLYNSGDGIIEFSKLYKTLEREEKKALLETIFIETEIPNKAIDEFLEKKDPELIDTAGRLSLGTQRENSAAQN